MSRLPRVSTAGSGGLGESLSLVPTVCHLGHEDQLVCQWRWEWREWEGGEGKRGGRGKGRGVEGRGAGDGRREGVGRGGIR